MTGWSRDGRLALLLIALGLASCAPGPGELVARGFITDLQVRDLTRTEWIKLRIEGGSELELRVAESVQFTPGHLREHMVFGEPVTVTYRQERDGAVAIEISD